MTTKQQLLTQAEKLMGRKKLAAGLKVTEPIAEAWINGQLEVPDRKLLELADPLDHYSRHPN
jgi:ferric-dicitrate binding protein FerR (iron transport regulator)